MDKKRRPQTKPVAEIPSDRKARKRAKKFSTITTISLLLIAVFVVVITIYKLIDFFVIKKSEDDTFPKLKISLSEIPIEQIDAGSKDIKYPGNTATFIINGQSTTYEDVEIKGRGNATWDRSKKPYQIKFYTKESLFNLGENKKWILLANYSDHTSLRTSLAFRLEQLLNEKYPLHGNFIELYIDNIYRGLYYLTEKVEIDKNRVNLTDQYGVLVELDNLYGEKEGCHYTYSNDCLILKDSVNEDSENQAMQNFLKDFNSLNMAIDNQNYEKIEDLIDVDSFVRYYLLNEFTINPDAYSTSFYMHKNGGESKIYAGPGWDFDAAFGNETWTTVGVDNKIIHSPSETMPFKNYLNKYEEVPYSKVISSIIYKLTDIPEFKTRVKEIYQETISGKKDDLLSYIQNQATYIRDAAIRDQERWKLKTNFDEEVDYLIDWVGKRYDHFEKTYGKDSQSTSETPAEPTELENLDESTEV